MTISLVTVLSHIKFAYVFTDHSISIFVNSISPGVRVLLLCIPLLLSPIPIRIFGWLRELESSREETNIPKLKYE